jgi:hypothetical protein
LTEIAFSTLSPPAFGSARAKATAIAEYSRHHPVPAPLIGSNDAPVNILGGFKFSNAPRTDLAAEIVSRLGPDDPRVSALIDTIPSDLSVPPFLRRSRSSSETET